VQFAGIDIVRVDAKTFYMLDGRQGPAQRQAGGIRTRLQNSRIDGIFQRGLHEFIGEFITENNQLGSAITEQFLL
jgi:uncharacterized alpha-E superfamily protein